MQNTTGNTEIWESIHEDVRPFQTDNEKPNAQLEINLDTSPDLELPEAHDQKTLKLENSQTKVSMGVQTSRVKLASQTPDITKPTGNNPSQEGILIGSNTHMG